MTADEAIKAMLDRQEFIKTNLTANVENHTFASVNALNDAAMLGHIQNLAVVIHESAKLIAEELRNVGFALDRLPVGTR